MKSKTFSQGMCQKSTDHVYDTDMSQPQPVSLGHGLLTLIFLAMDYEAHAPQAYTGVPRGVPGRSGTHIRMRPVCVSTIVTTGEADPLDTIWYRPGLSQAVKEAVKIRMIDVKNAFFMPVVLSGCCE
ncbi:hypothetical protein FKB34_08735 [Glycocaulis profundi]|nr:hypothetical protein FKB34_08735 [Glycocaulis profundi]